MQMLLNRWRSNKISKRWAFIAVCVVLMLATPILTLLFKLPAGPGESWSHVVEYLLPGYLTNTASLVMLCTIFSFVMGVIPAWIVSQYDFRFRAFLEWALILPLAIPGYLTAYAYAGFFDYKGSYELLMTWLKGHETIGHFNIMGTGGLALVLSCSLFPYVYIAARSFFLFSSSGVD